MGCAASPSKATAPCPISLAERSGGRSMSGHKRQSGTDSSVARRAGHTGPSAAHSAAAWAAWSQPSGEAGSGPCTMATTFKARPACTG